MNSSSKIELQLGKKRDLDTFDLYSDTVKSNILLKDKRSQKLWNNIKVGSIYMIEDNNEEEMILYPRHDIGSFKEYNYQERPWYKSIKENSNPSEFGITAPYQDNDGTDINFNLTRTLWYKFEDQGKSYFILFDLFVDSSEMLSIQEQLTLNIYYWCFIVLFSIILFIFLIQMNFAQMNLNWNEANRFIRNNTERGINRFLEIINRRPPGNDH